MTKRFDENRQAAKQEVNTLSDTAKEQYEKGEITEAQYQAKRENYKNLGLLIDTVASGLSAPTSSGLGIATATLSPAASYEIGQYFKEQANNNANGQLTSVQEAAYLVSVASGICIGGKIIKGKVSANVDKRLPVSTPTVANNGLIYRSNPKHTLGGEGNRPNAGIEPKTL